MKEPHWAKCTEEELWKYVATHLTKNGIDTVLVGGAVVSIYSDGAYRSGDLDLVIQTFMIKKLPEVMAKIDFRQTQGRHYQHPKCKHLFVEFASPPASIGADTEIEPAEVKSEGVRIKLFSPTDCIRDRLASYLYFKAAPCLDQAVLVAKKHPFDPKKVKGWCKSEGAPQLYDEFMRTLKSAK